MVSGPFVSHDGAANRNQDHTWNSWKLISGKEQVLLTFNVEKVSKIYSGRHMKTTFASYVAKFVLK